MSRLSESQIARKAYANNPVFSSIVKQKESKSGADYFKLAYKKEKLDTTGKEQYAIVRFLYDRNGNIRTQTRKHWLELSSGKRVINCPETIDVGKKGDCPICEMRRGIWKQMQAMKDSGFDPENANDPKMLTEYNKFTEEYKNTKPSFQTLAPIYVIKDTCKPENEGKVFLYGINKKIQTIYDEAVIRLNEEIADLTRMIQDELKEEPDVLDDFRKNEDEYINYFVGEIKEVSKGNERILGLITKAKERRGMPDEEGVVEKAGFYPYSPDLGANFFIRATKSDNPNFPVNFEKSDFAMPTKFFGNLSDEAREEKISEILEKVPDLDVFKDKGMFKSAIDIKKMLPMYFGEVEEEYKSDDPTVSEAKIKPVNNNSNFNKPEDITEEEKDYLESLGI